MEVLKVSKTSGNLGQSLIPIITTENGNMVFYTCTFTPNIAKCILDEF